MCNLLFKLKVHVLIKMEIFQSVKIVSLQKCKKHKIIFLLLTISLKLFYYLSVILKIFGATSEFTMF